MRTLKAPEEREAMRSKLHAETADRLKMPTHCGLCGEALSPEERFNYGALSGVMASLHHRCRERFYS